ncbi:serine carboxypeptidase II-3-like isoform X2 [Triticum urartu]|uniref:serine carboxypeptidase II-3-like isoform X2 n=1 Tax=Triticum urartu TaxID=4572 RepID=UPI002043A8BC|nr:serine carboxypeptidase II-3-like isoform X2 [Triticum urartu]XP_048554923.1 serine carboxypeptidase II-3-like isoform X2 [Triticum urartu]
MRRAVLMLVLVLVQCLALGCGTAAAARARQGDLLRRLRWSSSLAAVEEPTRATASRRPKPVPVPAAEVGRKEADRVDALPGQPRGVDFAQYAGYVTVDPAAGRALFYYLAEAVGGNGNDDGSSSKGKPLLLWLNGGPGCSSLGYGAMEELGPFRVMSDGKTLYRNPYSWNHAANVLFLESPAGVGYSYSNTTADYGRGGDNRTAEDAYQFLANWLERFPEYKGRDFYIAGESYAGHFAPQLAHAVLRHASPAINLKGVMIGNAVINEGTDKKGTFDFYWTHALISDETATGVNQNCNFTNGAQSNDLCDQANDDVVENLRDIDNYNIYAPNCQTEGLVTPPITPSIESFDTCTSNYVEAYLNKPDVQKALHANVTRLNHPWLACSEVLTRWVDSTTTVLPIIRELMKNNIRVWVYRYACIILDRSTLQILMHETKINDLRSGDTDGNVPVTATRYSINQLQLPVAAKWRRWFSSTKGAGEVGGYVVQYKGGLSLVTVRGAGHEVPSYQPRRALQLVQAFLAGTTLPDCKKC